MIALSCDIKILPVGSSDYSQSTRVMDGWTEGENCDSQDRASIARAVKTVEMCWGAPNSPTELSL